MATSVTVTPSSGNGVTTTFTLATAQASVAVYVDRLRQYPTTDYTFVANSTSIVFVTAPVSGSILYVEGDTAVTAATGTTTLSGVTTGTVTLATLRSSVRQRADMVNSQFVTDSELDGYINSSAAELYDKIVEAYGEEYYSAAVKTPYQFTTDGTNEMFALPDGSTTYQLPSSGGTAPAFYKLLGVEVQVNGSPTGWATLHPFPFIERNRYSFPGLQSAYGLRGRLKYRIHGNYLWLKPLPISGQVIRLWYVPRYMQLVNTTDVLDGFSGWDEYVVIDAAIKCLQKEESDVSVLLVQKGAFEKRLESITQNRDIGSPATVGDIRRSAHWGGQGYADFSEGEW